MSADPIVVLVIHEHHLTAQPVRHGTHRQADVEAERELLIRATHGVIRANRDLPWSHQPMADHLQA